MFYLLISLLVLLFSALISLALKSRLYTASLSTSSSLISLLLLTAAALNSSTYVELYSWGPLGTAGLRLDGLSLTFAVVILLVSISSSIFSSSYMVKRFEELGSQRWGTYFFLFLTFVFGMLGTVLSTNLLEFYIFFELMLIPSYFLVAEFGHEERGQASFSYFLWTHIGALIMLAGLISLALSYKTLDIQSIYMYTHNLIPLPSGFSIPQSYILYASVAIVIGLMVKLGGFGVHVWLPLTYKEAPAPVAVLLSAAMSGIAGYAIIRLVALGVPSAFSVISPYLVAWGLVSLIYGGFMALAQDDVKLLLAYSSISQMGYMVIGIGSATSFGIAGSISLYAANGMAKGILFMMAGILAVSFGKQLMSQMGGLAKKLPYTATFSMIGFLTMMGVPPTIGFIAEFFIFQGIFSASLTAHSYIPIWLALASLIASIITTGYSLWAIKKVFFGQVPEELKGINVSFERGYLLPLALFSIISIALGVYPFLFSYSLNYVTSSIHLMTGGV